MFGKSLKKLFGRKRNASTESALAASSPSATQMPSDGLEKTRSKIFSGIRALFSSNLEQSKLEQKLESILYTADIGADLVSDMMTCLDGLDKPWNIEAVLQTWEKFVCEILERHTRDLESDETFDENPKVILMIGVNGTGKTTTTAKLAKLFVDKGLSVLLGAADTYRAAAQEQLIAWAERLKVPYVRGQEGGDAAAVAFDCVKSGISNGCDIIIIDTAGRLHTHTSLLQSLEKLKRSSAKALGRDVDEVWLTLDANTGQNSLAQAKEFHETMGVTGLIVTKLDSSAKGGSIVGVVNSLGIPILFTGVGEKSDDLRFFDAKEFSKGLFSKNLG